MFSVIFEVTPRPEKLDAYLNMAAMLKSELERIDGFIENVRYRSLTRGGLICRCRTGETRKRSCDGEHASGIMKPNGRAATSFFRIITFGLGRSPVIRGHRTDMPWKSNVSTKPRLEPALRYHL